MMSVAVISLLAAMFLRSPSSTVLADGKAAANTPNLLLDFSTAAPRRVEDATEKAVARDYSAAWQIMTQALEQNRADLLDSNFIGTANDKLKETIQEQSRAGLHRRYVDRGHKLQAIFYSHDGSAMELHDTVQLSVQLLDGDKVVASKDLSAQYVVLMTAAENSWKVRVLQEVPAI
jgi:hypothetical protein